MKKIAFVLALLPSVAFAQSPDPAFLGKVIDAMQAQRNSVADQLAVSEAKANLAQERLQAAQKQITDLQAQVTKLQAQPATPPASPKAENQ
jgi:peptidoglycan hydrolase CwlO-like protein